MRYTHFEVINFKGIANIRLDLTAKPLSNVFTLIGLNESGKTTVLEAINFLSYRADLDPLNLPGYSTRDVHELIPIARRSNFNDKIVIKAGFECDPEDELLISNRIRKELGITLSQPIGRFHVAQSYEFKNSQVVPGQPTILWWISLFGRKKGERRPRKLEADDWKAAVAIARSQLPSVLYFPNFLFEFPDRIYLEEHPTDAKKHEFYRGVLQDVLDAIGEHTNLKDHVLARAQSTSGFDKKSLESVLLKMGSNITTTVFSNWDRIFKRTIGKKEIVVGIDQDEENRWYLQLRLKDGNELYSISERSLGFRWFFTFLLLTQYRGFRKDAPKNSVFLLDEPASNLHPSAQNQLLESFGKFPGRASIIYTTHSHHMVNPEWLEGAFVVRNEGLDYDAEDDGYSARKTLVTLHRYRDFAAQHPNQSTYFQPVLDVLDYAPSRLDNVPNVVMLEGKNDFYTLKYFQQQLGSNKTSLNLLPGSGAGSLTDVLRLYIAWGREFFVLLDSDSEGKAQKQRYESLFGVLIEGRIASLEQIDASWVAKGFEFLLSEPDRLALQTAVYPTEAKYKKTLYNRAIQELFLTRKAVSISEEGTERFARLLAFLKSKF